MYPQLHRSYVFGVKLVYAMTAVHANHGVLLMTVSTLTPNVQLNRPPIGHFVCIHPPRSRQIRAQWTVAG